MAFVNLGRVSWGGSRDDEGYREYKVKFRLRGDDDDGPAQALLTPGLPVYGSTWNFGNDLDDWAWCRWNATMTVQVENEKSKFFFIEYTFSTKPTAEKACKDTQVEDPLLEPYKVSGSFVKYQEEVVSDKDGKKVLNTAFEPFKGAQAEFDANRPQVKVEQNVAALGLSTFAPMIDGLNDRAMWGLPARCIKLSNVSWEKKFYGICYAYYTRSLEFDIRYPTKEILDSMATTGAGGFDRFLLNEGTKVLYGKWVNGDYVIRPVATGKPADVNNPRHYVRFKDPNNENARCIIDSETGGPWFPDAGTGTGPLDNTPPSLLVQKYASVNFGLLNVPTTL